MSLYADPDKHAANPPDTWTVARRDTHSWVVVDKSGTVLDYFTTKRAALAHLEDPDWWVRRLYDKETRWYAGEQVPGWKPYARPAS